MVMLRPALLLWFLLVILLGLGLFACSDASNPPPIIPQSDAVVAEASAGDAGPMGD
jgi:hypothetical protein